MILTEEEQNLIKESLSLYLQLAAQQMPRETLDAIATQAKTIAEKLPLLGRDNSDGSPANKPHNISDEWFEQVCTGCQSLTATGCNDTVTQKFPGKCDPILKFEMQKRAGL